MAVTVLACSADEERVALLNRWIEIAIETKTALGNMYGFAGLLLGLLMPQVLGVFATVPQMALPSDGFLLLFLSLSLSFPPRSGALIRETLFPRLLPSLRVLTYLQVVYLIAALFRRSIKSDRHRIVNGGRVAVRLSFRRFFLPLVQASMLFIVGLA